jgi:hypothetical protein
MNSRANFDRRQRRLEERLDPKWLPEADEPVLGGGASCYEVAQRCVAIGCGGLGMLQAVVGAVGLREEIDESLHLLKRHLPYHESDHVLSLVYNVLTGGQCLEDLEARRSDEGFLNRGRLRSDVTDQSVSSGSLASPAASVPSARSDRSRRYDCRDLG